MSLVVTAIGSYVDANEDKLIGKAIIGAKTASLLNLQTGVKGTANLNLLTAASGLADGSSCGFSASGDVTVTKRQIVSKMLKVNQTFCDKTLVGTSLQHGVKLAAGLRNLPFEEYFVNQVVGEVNKSVETIIWQGNTALTATTNMLMDGFVALLSGETSKVDGSIAGGALSGTSAMVKLTIDNMAFKMPDAIVDRSDLVIFCGYDVFRKYVQALQAANLFHYTENFDGKMSIMIPGTNVRLEGVYGLSGLNKAYGTYLENMYLGVDLENAQEAFKFWFSEDDDIYKLKIFFNLGVQVAFPDYVVYGV